LFRSRCFLLVPALLVSGLLSAHAKITLTRPADGDFVAAPQELVLEFDHAVRLTGLAVVTVSGERREIEPLPAAAAASFNIDLDGAMPPGEYYVVWQAIATDSHFSTGEFFFTVVAD